jgi:TonB family protein
MEAYLRQTKYLLYLGASIFGGLILVAMSLAKPQAPATEQPKVISAAAPIYPPLAYAARVSGDAVAEVEVDATGAVTSVRFEGHPLLRAASDAAAKRWRFAPTEKDRASRRAKITFTFRPLENELPADQITPVFYPPYKIEVMHNPNTLHY